MTQKIVCDTCSIIRLHKGIVLHYLPKIFGNILIPQAVKDECNPDIDISIFECIPVKKIFDIGMGRGEREAISLAMEYGIGLITDDDQAFNKAKTFNILPIRSTAILVIMKRKGHVKSVRHVMDTIIKNGDGIAEYRYYDTLRLSGES